MQLNQEASAVWATEVKAFIDHHILMIYGSDGAEVPVAMEHATEAAATSNEHVGAFGGVMVVEVPMQTFADAPTRVERWAAEPGEDHGEWDYVAEGGVAVSTGMLSLVGGGTEAVTVPVPFGDYRARVSARGYLANASEPGELELRVQLWPGSLEGQRVIKQWFAWDS